MSQTFETVGRKFETSQSFLEMSQTFETVVNHSQVVEWMAEAEATFTSVSVIAGCVKAEYLRLLGAAWDGKHR
jgi:hypothetical protein